MRQFSWIKLAASNPDFSGQCEERYYYCRETKLGFRKDRFDSFTNYASYTQEWSSPPLRNTSLSLPHHPSNNPPKRKRSYRSASRGLICSHLALSSVTWRSRSDLSSCSCRICNHSSSNNNMQPIRNYVRSICSASLSVTTHTYRRNTYTMTTSK